MTLVEFLSHLRGLDVRVWVDGDRLRCDAPSGVLTPELRAELAERKGEIIAFLGAAQDAVQATAAPIRPVPREGHPPLSFSQQRLWFLDQLEPNNPAYNIPAAVRLTGSLDVAALRESINAIIRRHEALRTTLGAIDSEVVQIVAPLLALSLPLVDLAGLPGAEREAEARRLAMREAQRPFELTRGPLLRITLLRMGAQEHVLLLTLHHAISDDWSMNVFVRELIALYQAGADKRSSHRAGRERFPLPDLPIQYADYAVWQREWLQGDVLETQLSYWKEQLSGVSDLPKLPTDRPRPALQTFRGERQGLLLPAALVNQLKALSQQQEGTLFMTLLAAFEVLLHQYSGQTSVVVGSPVANRNRTEVEGLIGFFVNTVVLRSDLSGDPTFRELLNRVRKTTVGAYAHQDLPFERLVEALHPQRDLSRNPLFQVFFNMLSFASAQVELPGLKVEPLSALVIGAPAIGAKFDMTMYVIPHQERVQLDIFYNADLFEQATVAWLLAHLETLLQSVAASPDQRLSALPRLAAMEGDRVRPKNAFVGFLKDEVEQSIPDRFKKQVAKYPDKIAVWTDNQILTYDGLDGAANRVARTILAQCGSGEGRVALLFEQGASLIVAILGTLKAGKTYVPLAPSYPRERLLYMLSDSQADAILTNDVNLALATALAPEGCPVINADKIGQDVAEAEVGLSISPDTATYILYTSGSTGQPKGTLQNHRNVLHFVMNYTNGLHISPQDRLSLLYSCSFSAAVMDTFAALLNGATLYPFDVLEQGIDALADWLLKHEITVYHSVPTVFRHFIATLSPELAFPQLRLIDLGGEPVSQRDVEQFKRHFSSDCILVNGLGATELNVIRQYFIDRQTPVTGSNVPVGYAVADTEILLLDDDGRPVGFNRSGEIAIKSQYLSPGYWRRPDLTQAVFEPDPQGGQARVYRTGDLGRMRPDGCLEHLGRKDFQVKIRGIRIETAEVEVALLGFDAVREAVVVAREDASGEKQLVAYVVAQEGKKPTSGELRRYLQERLPDYMVPVAVVPLDALPQTPNGKVDRRALPAPEEIRPETEAGFVAPRTPAEEMLAGVWAEILGLAQVGVHDDFFDLGGHSLLATQVISRVRDIFQVELSLRELFDSLTIASVVERIEAARRLGDGLSAPPLLPVPREGELPLSFAQQRLWFLNRLEPASAAYNLPAAVRLSGLLDVRALAQSFSQVVRRHETLRTTFATANGRAVQVIAPALTVTLPLIDLRALPQAEREAEARRLVLGEMQRHFDLARGPLVRASLLRLGYKDHVLVLNMHHIISDGWSIGVLVHEMVALYQAYTTGKPSPLAELPLQYADFAVWQREWLQGQVLETELSYWKGRLGDARGVLELPTDQPRPAVQTYRGAIYTFTLSEELTTALRALSRGEGSTLFITLLAAFKTLLYRYTGQKDILVGTPIANRDRAEIEGLIGFFVNTLVLRTDLVADLKFRELLARVREGALDAYAHQHLPFEMLVEELQPERDLSRSPLFQVMFVLQNAPMTALEAPGLTLTPLEIERGAAQFDLTLNVTEAELGLAARLEYNTDLFDAATMARMADHFKTLLEAVVADPDGRISDLPLLADAERRKLLLAWNHTKVTYPQQRCIHKLFEEQVAQTPDATAVVFPVANSAQGQDLHLTYRELNHQANRLAHYLQEIGVGPESRVGVCVERSLEMVIGLYGVLKAGGAYVPLDPTYPPARLAFMAADAQVPVLLTQEKLRPTLSDRGARVVCLDADEEALVRQSPHNLDSGVGEENLVYVIYTSGSTGAPKGAMNTHAGIRNRLLWMQDAYSLTGTDRVLQKTPFSFDVSVWEFFWPLLNGACLVVARPEGHKDSAYLVETIAEQHVTTMHFVPSMLQVFVEARGVEACRSLRRVICSGEALPFDLQERFFARLGAELHNLYGPTEAAVDVTFWPCEREAERRVVPIGRPIANTQIYLLDASLQPLPVGVPGELHIGGAGLARGYHNRPELTAERFIPVSPFASPPGDGIEERAGLRLYKTGDLARYLLDGNIEFLGRIDHQVKVRGFRIELGEIETVLGQHPDVRETVIVAQGEDSNDKRLVAYMVLSNEHEPAVDELRRFIQDKLPEYMVPSAFVTLEALPLTPSGKVNRRALPAPDGERPELSTIYVSPRSEAERTIAAIWEQILGVERVGVNDNFFDLGGHSLLVVQVHDRLVETFGKEFPMTEMFKYTTVAALAQHLSQAQEQERADIVQKTKERAAARRALLRRRVRER